MGGKTETDISNAELINGLQHMADDHPCCKDTISMTIDQLKQLKRENAALRKALQLVVNAYDEEQAGGELIHRLYDVSRKARAVLAARKEAQS